MQIRSCKNPDKPTPLEKEHLPQINIIKKEGFSSIGEIHVTYQHPMIKEHHLEWIKIYRNDTIKDRVNLCSGDKAEAIFKIKLDQEDELKIFAKCSQHGIWQTIKESF
jgi:desulfoferrodoxin-like iron-binding protein